MADIQEKCYHYDDLVAEDDDPMNFTEEDVRRIEARQAKRQGIQPPQQTQKTQKIQEIQEINYGPKEPKRGGLFSLCNCFPKARSRRPDNHQNGKSAGAASLIPFIDEDPEYLNEEEEEETDEKINQDKINQDKTSNDLREIRYGYERRTYHYTFVRDAFDGFGGSDSDDIRRFMRRIGGPRQHLRHHWRRHRRFGDKDWKCNRRFNKIDKDTGRIHDAVDGSKIFHKGGRHNQISDVGKVVLDKILSGEDKKVEPLEQKPAVQEVTGIESLGLDFNKERDRCLQSKTLFEDPEFGAESKSLYYRNAPPGPVKWLRPHDIVQDPCFLVDGESRFDVCQGQLGDCWLLAAIANLTLRDELFFRVVPPDQSFTENYAGIFHFRFWRYGKWVDVVIDDRLPTLNGKLLYMRSASQNEFWSALIEKAYAKVFTCYECLDGGLPMDALVDFTGGLTEHFDLRKTDKNTLLAMIVRGFQMGSFFCASIDADPNTFENQLSNGLIMGHAYSITAIQTVETTSGDVTLLRIRNPWGNSKEWNGGWSDKSSLWDTVSQTEKSKLQVAFNDDGEFWMSFDDFMTSYEQLEVCNLSADVEDEIERMTGVVRDDGKETGSWQEDTCDGSWSSKDNSAGGCINYISSFPKNPQFQLSLTNAKNGVEGDGNCTVVVGLMQKNRRELRIQGKDDLPIGFSVYKAPQGNNSKLNEQFFRTNQSIAKVPVFTNMREVTARFRVPPGEYVVVPSTFEPYQEADFLIRTYSNGDLNMTALK